MAARPRTRVTRLARMPGIRATASALAVVCAVALTACGSDDEGTIPPENGDAMLAQLDDVEQSVAANDCDTARSAAVGFTEQVDDLPSEVDPDVRKALVDAGNNLVQLTTDADQCSQTITGPSGQTGATEETDPTTEPPAEETPPPEEETPPAEEETPPADEGGNGNQGNGNGNGNGGEFSGGGENSGGGIGSEG